MKDLNSMSPMEKLNSMTPMEAPSVRSQNGQSCNNPNPNSFQCWKHAWWKMVGVGSSRLPYHALFMVNGGRGSSNLPYHAPFIVNSGPGSSLLPHHPPFYARWWAWFKSFTYHAPFVVNGGRGSSHLPMPRPFYDVNQCNKKNISNDLYCCFFCLICFYMTIDYYYYLF